MNKIISTFLVVSIRIGSPVTQLRDEFEMCYKREV